MWKPDYMPALHRIEESMHEAVTDLKALRTNERLWAQAFDSILAISKSTCKHLVGPQLVLLGHSACAESKDQAQAVETFAAGVELHHVFMLIHDDIADSGTLRRGVPTISVALADVAPFPHLSRVKLDQLATVIGDAVHARSMSLMFKGAVAAKAPEACEAVLKGAYRAGAAQFDDLAGWSGVESLFKNGNTSDQILRRLMIEKRAFHGWISPLLAGLKLGLGPAVPSASFTQMESFCHAWAEHVGIASQALDDLADMLLSPADTGKDSLQDLRDGRLSMPVFLLMQRASPKERAALRELLLRPDGAMILSDRRRVLDLMEKYSLRDACIQFAKSELTAATQLLESYQSTAANTAGNAKLCDGLSFYGNAVTDLVVALADNGKFNTREHRMGLWPRSSQIAVADLCDSTQHCVVP
jgi:geranylgeranyl diphosphate synthase type I